MNERLIGLVVYTQIAALDIVGPYEVLGGLARPGNPFGFKIVWLAETMEPVTAHQGLRLLPQTTFAESPPLDILIVPGGPGQVEQMKNPKMIRFLTEKGAQANVVSSVCTGSLLLAKAGLLTGKKATSHWMVMDQLAEYGAIPTRERVVKDGNIITAAGVSAGIDMALTLAADLVGPEIAQAIQLDLEYDPQPPFNSGSPTKAPPEVLARFNLP